MDQRSLRGLILLNAILLVAVALLSFTPQPADAQLGGGGDYIMVAGQSGGAANRTIYITNLRDGSILAVTYDPSRRRIEPLDVRNIKEDFEARPAR